MRVIVYMIFILQVSFAESQQPEIVTYTLKKAMNDALRKNPTATSDSGRKKLGFEIKSAWYCWMYRILKYQTLQEYQTELSDLERIAILRSKAGEDDAYETLRLLGKYAEIQTSAAISFNDIGMSHNSIRQLLFSDNAVVPADTTLPLYEIDKGFAYDAPQLVHNDTSALFRYETFIFSTTIENKQLELDNLFIRLQYYNSYGLARATHVLRSAKARYKYEEIDFTGYVDLLTEAYNIKLEYLEILNSYNQRAIQLEYYAY